MRRSYAVSAARSVLRAGVVAVLAAVAGCGGSSGVTGGGGGNTNGGTTPSINGVSRVIDASTLPQTVTVNGTGFQAGLTVTVTSGSATTHPTPTQITSTSFQITAVLSTGSYSISAANPGGQSSSTFAFSVKAANGTNFAQPVSYATGASTTGGGGGSGSIALADFNGDGKLDIAVSNYSSNTISVFLNKGDGSFGAPIMTAVNPSGALGLGAIISGDFNEDGKPDLVVGTIAGGQSDIVLLGNGDGTFKQGTQVPNSSGFFQGKAVDLNGDKHLDLIVGSNGNMSVALGKGDGTFQAAVQGGNAPLSDSYLGMDVGDLTGNGKLDFVGADWQLNAGDIVVFLGNGDGTLRAPTWQTDPTLPGSTAAGSVALADFNGDGKLDLLMGYQYAVQMALGNGDGTFQMGSPVTVYSSIPIAYDGIYVRAADMDQDGKPDALMIDYGAGTLTIVLNNAANLGSGTRSTYTIASGLADIAVGDLNGDGLPDVVLVNDKTDQITVFLSQSQ